MGSQLEIERKFLIALPDTAELERRPGAEVWDITQTYLAEGGRIRCIRCNGQERFIRTVKQDRTAVTRLEEETVLQPAEYRRLLTHKAAGSQTLRKVRYRFPFQGHTVEVDVFPFWNDRALLEVELQAEDEAFALPSCIRLLREVTADKRYRNASLAKAIPTDDLASV